MATIPGPGRGAQARPADPAIGSWPQPSANGGVLLLLAAWTVLGGSARLGAGLAWQGPGAGLLLFALVALPLLGAPSVRAIAQHCTHPSDPLWLALGWATVVTQRRLARFVTSHRHRWTRCLGAMMAALAQHPATRIGRDGVLVVDSTTIEKRYGRHLPHRRPVYDSCQQRLVDGYEVVSACAVGPAPAAAEATTPGGGLRSWPLGLELHQPPTDAGERTRLKRRRRPAQPGEAPSKLDRALGLVAQATTQGLALFTVVGDSAFCVMWWLRELAVLGLDWLVSTRADRRLRIGATVLPFRDWLQQLAGPLTLLAPHPHHPQAGLWGRRLPTATLLDKGWQVKGLACQPAYVERRDRHGRVTHRWYLVTSHLDWDLPTIWTRWTWRWAIEGLHRDAKQHLALDAFHCRTWAGLVGWVAAASLRASLLAFLRALEPTCGGFATGACVAALRQAAVTLTPRAATRVEVSWPVTLPAPTLRAQASREAWPDGWPTTLHLV